MSITEQLEHVKEKMCTEYCKYTNTEVPEGHTEDYLWEIDNSPCDNCPLNSL